MKNIHCTSMLCGKLFWLFLDHEKVFCNTILDCALYFFVDLC